MSAFALVRPLVAVHPGGVSRLTPVLTLPPGN